MLMIIIISTNLNKDCNEYNNNNYHYYDKNNDKNNYYNDNDNKNNNDNNHNIFNHMHTILFYFIFQ